jgi:hypothetical protein
MKRYGLSQRFRRLGFKKVPDKADRFYQAMLLACFAPGAGTLDTLGEDDFELVISTKPRL